MSFAWSHRFHTAVAIAYGLAVVAAGAGCSPPTVAPPPVAGANAAPANVPAIQGETKPRGEDPAAPAPSAGDGPALPAGTPAASSAASEAELFATLSNQFRRIPKDSKDSKISRDEWQRRVEQILPLCHDYLERFPEGANVPEVCCMTAKLLVIYNSHREKLPVVEWRVADAAAYFRMVDDLIARGLARNPSPKVRLDLEKVRGEGYYFGKQYERAAEHYGRLLAEHPADEERDKSWMSRLTVLKDLGRSSEILESAAAFLGAHPRSEYLPHVLGLVADTQMQLGNLSGASAVWEKYGDLLKRAADGEAVPIGPGGEDYTFPPRTKHDFGAQAEQSDFWLGYMAWVEGRIDAARKHYEASIAYLDARTAAKSVTDVGKVFAQRVRREYGFLELVQGKPGAELDGLDWATEEFLDMRAERERGSVVALLFAGQEWPRSRPIVELLSDTRRDQRDLRFGCAWIVNPRGTRDLPQQRSTVQAALKELEADLPAGFDVGDKMPIFERYHCAVGGGTLVVLDREGRCAWYKMDPTARDLLVARLVIDRLLAEPVPAGR